LASARSGRVSLALPTDRERRFGQVSANSAGRRGPAVNPKAEKVRSEFTRTGRDFHLQVKINAMDFNDALWPWQPKGTTLEKSIRVCQWVEAAGAHALHISVGSIFPHPLLPPDGFPADELN